MLRLCPADLVRRIWSSRFVRTQGDSTIHVQCRDVLKGWAFAAASTAAFLHERPPYGVLKEEREWRAYSRNVPISIRRQSTKRKGKCHKVRERVASLGAGGAAGETPGQSGGKILETRHQPIGEAPFDARPICPANRNAALSLAVRCPRRRAGETRAQLGHGTDRREILS